MLPSLTAPPAPHSFFSRVASASSSASGRGRPAMTETPFPPLPATSRPTRTAVLPGLGTLEERLRAEARCAPSRNTTPRKVCFVFKPAARALLLGTRGRLYNLRPLDRTRSTQVSGEQPLLSLEGGQPATRSTEPLGPTSSVSTEPSLRATV